MLVRNAANKRSPWQGTKGLLLPIFLSAKDHFTGSKFYSQARIYDTSLASRRDWNVKFSVKATDSMK